MKGNKKSHIHKLENLPITNQLTATKTRTKSVKDYYITALKMIVKYKMSLKKLSKASKPKKKTAKLRHL